MSNITRQLRFDRCKLERDLRANEKGSSKPKNTEQKEKLKKAAPSLHN